MHVAIFRQLTITKIDCLFIGSLIDNKEIKANVDIEMSENYGNCEVRLGPSEKLFYINENVLCDEMNRNRIYGKAAILVVAPNRIGNTNCLKIAKKMNYGYTVNLTGSKCWSEEFFDDSIFAPDCDMTRKEETLSAVKAFMKEKKIKFDAIVTFLEYSVQMASYLAEELGCLGIPFEVAKTVQNKYEFRKYCDQLGIVTPGFSLIKFDERQKHVEIINCFQKAIGVLNNDEIELKLNTELVKTLTHVSMPFIAKNPVGAIKGISLSDYFTRFLLAKLSMFPYFILKDFVRKCSTVMEYRQVLLDSMRFTKMDLLIEEFYDGYELDIDILVQNNQAVFVGITDNFKSEEPNFFESDSATPSLILSKQEIHAIETIVTEWVPRWNLKNALLHFEAFCRPISLYPNRNYDISKPFENTREFFMPIELNLRLGGGEVWSVNYSAYGVDLFTSYIHLMLGCPLDKGELKLKQNNPKNKCIASSFYPDTVPAKIENVSLNMQAIRQSCNIVEVSLFKPVGDFCNDKGYIGWMTIRDSIDASTDDLFQASRKCMDLVKYEFGFGKLQDVEHNKTESFASMCLAENQKTFFLREKVLEDYSEMLDVEIYRKEAILILCSSVADNTNYIKRAKEMNYGYIVNLTSTKCWAEEFVDDFIFAEDRDLSKKDETLVKIKCFMETKRIKFDAVIGLGDPVVEMAAYLAEELGCLGTPLNVAQTIQNKYTFRQYCNGLGIATSKYALVKSNDRLKHIDMLNSLLAKCVVDNSLRDDFNHINLLNNVDLPFVIKNVSGSRKGIKLINSIKLKSYWLLYYFILHFPIFFRFCSKMFDNDRIQTSSRKFDGVREY
jgi:hypothetical protein